MEGTLLQWISQYGYLGIFCLLMFGIIGLPIPDEVLLAFSGYLVFKGQLAMAPTIASAFLGSICGVSVSYSIGRTGGSFLVRKYGRWFHVTQEKIDRVHEWLEHEGKWGLSIGYFIPGIRHLALSGGNIATEVSCICRICVHRRPVMVFNFHFDRLFPWKRMDRNFGINPSMDFDCSHCEWLRASVLLPVADERFARTIDGGTNEGKVAYPAKKGRFGENCLTASGDLVRYIFPYPTKLPLDLPESSECYAHFRGVINDSRQSPNC